MRRLFVSCSIALGSAACGDPSAAPTSPMPPVLPPKAALTVSAGDISPALGVGGFTPFVFDGSHSTGDGLSYLLEFGDGATSTNAVAAHVTERGGSMLTAKLTVTDRLGRSDSTTARYFVALIQNGFGTFWYYQIRDGQQVRQVTLRITQQGASLSGVYHESGASFSRHFTGSLNDQRTIMLRTEDGIIELAGTLEWKPDQPISMAQSRIVLRLAVSGGVAGGGTRDFSFADPY